MHTCTITRRHAAVLGIALLVAGGCRDDAGSPTSPEPGAALDITPAQTLSFRQVSAGERWTCGVTTANRAYCWGANTWGQLGDGTTTHRVRPVPVAGGLSWRQVAAGMGAHTCGTTTDNRAFCWGANVSGELGDGTTIRRLTPVPVAGGLQFRQVTTGQVHTCGVTTDNLAYCWGANGVGQLGDGTTTERVRPVPVAGGRRFSRVSAGWTHTCAVNPFNQGFCWGGNFAGQLGDNTTTQRLTPVRVAGGLLFRQVATGKLHSCGVTTGDQAYCWGKNSDGQLGDGTLNTRLKPVPVAGGLGFRQVTAGITQQQQQPGYSCGVTTDNRAYCWGGNRYGRLGIGTLGGRRLRPTAVVGELQFRQVDAGGNHACAVTTDDRAFCWGRNELGQLGNGTVGDSSSPVPVLGPS